MMLRQCPASRRQNHWSSLRPPFIISLVCVTPQKLESGNHKHSFSHRDSEGQDEVPPETLAGAAGSAEGSTGAGRLRPGSLTHRPVPGHVSPSPELPQT